jgi:hypothetical protein
VGGAHAERAAVRKQLDAAPPLRFTSNASRNFDGVYVDDIIVQSP